MNYQYHGTRWLKDGFSFPSLMEYITQKKQELSEPLNVPEYAAAREWEKAAQISEKLSENPYLKRKMFHQSLRNMMQDFGESKLLTYQENPFLYDICVFAVEYLMHGVPIIFLYQQTPESGLLYSAAAAAYQEQVCLYVSEQFFRENGMICEEELCYLIGHAVGHAQCHHAYIQMEAVEMTDGCEYSADRAGVLVCTARILNKHPEYSVAKAAREAVRYSVGMLLKMDIGKQNGPGATDWSGFDYQALQEEMDSGFHGASKQQVSSTSYSYDRHRIRAMVYFCKSPLLYRCMGKSVPEEEELYNEEQLAALMDVLIY